MTNVRTTHFSSAFGLVSLLWFAGCAKTAKVDAPPGPSVSTSPSSAAAMAAGNDLCAALQGNTTLMTDSKPFVDDLCSNGFLAALRADDRIYKGGPDAKIMDDAKELPNSQSSMKLYTSNLNDSDARSYFRMMKLELQKPSDFTAAGFESDQWIKYEVLKDNGDSVAYHYLNQREAPDVVVNYNATSKFYTVREVTTNLNLDTNNATTGNIYAISTALDKSLETAVSLQALVVIDEYLATVSGNQQMICEVFTLANQVYDNHNDHKTTLAKAEDSFAEEQKRAFRNGGKARAYFKDKP